MPKLGDEASVRERTHGPQVFDVDHNGLLRLAVAQVGDDAIVACRRVLHDATVAVDNERF